MKSQTIILLATVFVFFTASVAGRYQAFRKLGEFHQHVSYASVGVTLDFGPFQSYIQSIQRCLDNVRYTRMVGFGKTTFSRLSATADGIDKRMQEYSLFFKVVPSRVSRHRRQLAAIAGVGIGILALYDVESLKSTVGEMQSRQNVLVRNLESVTNETIVLANNFIKLRGAIAMMKDMDLNISHLLKIEIAIQQVNFVAEKYFSGLSSLMDGKLGIDLIKSDTAHDEFGQLKKEVFAKGYETVFQDYTQIYQLPASYLVVNGVISVVIDVPIVPIEDFGKFSLFRHDPLPFLLGDKLVKVQGESDLLAVSAHKNEFVEVSGSSLHSCLHVGSSFLCHFLGVTITEEYPCCLCSIFSAKVAEVYRTCNLAFLSERFRLERVNSTSFVSFTNKTVSGVVTCGKDQSQIVFSGYELKTLSPGCVVSLKGVTFVSAYSPKIEVQQVVSEFIMNTTFSGSISSINKSLTAALSDFDQIDFNALVRGGEELRALSPWDPISSRLWIAWGVVLLMVLVLVTGIIVIFCCRQRIFSWAVRGLAEGDRFHLARAVPARAVLPGGTLERRNRNNLLMQFSRLREADALRSREESLAAAEEEE